MDPRWPKRYSSPDFDPSTLTRKQLQDLVLRLGDEMIRPGARASKSTLVQWFYKVRPIMEEGLPTEHQEWLALTEHHRELALSRPAGQKTVPVSAAANTASTSKSAPFIDLTEDCREPAPSRSDSQKTIRTSASARTASTSNPLPLQPPRSSNKNGDVGHRGSEKSKVSAAPAAAGAQIAGPTTSWRPLDNYAPARRNTTGGVLANRDRVPGMNVSRHQSVANNLPVGRDISVSGTLATANRTSWRPLYTPDPASPEVVGSASSSNKQVAASDVPANSHAAPRRQVTSNEVSPAEATSNPAHIVHPTTNATQEPSSSPMLSLSFPFEEKLEAEHVDDSVKGNSPIRKANSNVQATQPSKSYIRSHSVNALPAKVGTDLVSAPHPETHEARLPFASASLPPLFSDNPTANHAEDPSKNSNSPHRANSNTRISTPAAGSRKRPHSDDHTPLKWAAEPVPAGSIKRLSIVDTITDENAEAEGRRKRVRL